MPKLIQAVGEFFDIKEKVTRQEGALWVVPNDRARGLERAGKIIVVEDWRSDLTRIVHTTKIPTTDLPPVSE